MLRGARGWRGLVAVALLGACARPPVPPVTPSPASATAAGTPAAEASSAASSATRAPPSAPPTTAAPARIDSLTICLAAEPQSLFPFARPEAGRAHILAALTDGPIDSAEYGFEPVLLESLPSLAQGDAVLNTALVLPGERVVDYLGRVRPLTEGVITLAPDGSLVTYSGSGTASLPQLVVTFRLRPGLTWSDGTPLTAADSVFAFDLGRSPEVVDPRRALAERTAHYRATSDASVVWSGLPGYFDPLYFTNFWTPLPRHRYEGLSATEIADSDEANRAPLSWGPFMLGEWTPGEQLVLVRNPRYWRSAEGLPRAERLIFRFLGEPADLIAALRSGTCDVAPSGAGLAELAEGLAGNEGIDVYASAGPALEMLLFAQQPAPGYAAAALLTEADGRRALAHCLDRDALMPPLAEPASAGYLPADHPLAEAALAGAAFDPAAGHELLAGMGWTDTDGDGVLDREDQPLALTLAAGPVGNPAREGLQTAVQAQLLANCGIVIAIQTLTSGELMGDWPDGVIFGRRFDLALFGWRVGAAPPCGLFLSEQVPDDDNPAGANAGGYASAEFDLACRRALTALDGPAAAGAHRAAQRIFARDLPGLPLFYWPRVGLARAGVVRYGVDPTSESELWNVEVVTNDEGRRTNDERRMASLRRWLCQLPMASYQLRLSHHTTRPHASRVSQRRPPVAGSTTKTPEGLLTASRWPVGAHAATPALPGCSEPVWMRRRWPNSKAWRVSRPVARSRTTHQR